MQPLQIVVKDIPNSAGIEDEIRKNVEKLERFYGNIISCHVAIELPEKRQQSGTLYNVHLRVYVPGREFVSTRNMQSNLWLAIRDAFYDMREDMQFYSAKIHRKTKRHPMDIHGEVVRLFDDYGFIEGLDGTEYYFNQFNVVQNKFKDLEVGTSVHFNESQGYESLQAKHIRIRKDHNHSNH